MRRFAVLAVGSLVGVSLTLGVGDLASAAPTSSSTSTSSSGTSTSTAPVISTSTTAAPGSSTTSTPSTPKSTSPKNKNTKKHGHRSHVLTGVEIWRIVKPGHHIDCAHSAQQLKRVKAADAAAAKRQTRWQRKSANKQAHQSRSAQAQKSTTSQSQSTSRATKHATWLAKQTKKAGTKVRSWQKLQQDGAALIKRIETTCPAKAPSH